MTVRKQLISLTVTICHAVDCSAVGAVDVLRARLLANGVRPRDLAKVLGVDRSAASMMLSGERNIPIWHLDTIAAHLHTTVAALFEENARDRSEGLSDKDLEVARRYRDLTDETLRGVVRRALGLSDPEKGEPQRETGRVAAWFRKTRRRRSTE